MIAQLQRVHQQRRRVDVCIAMNLPITQELRVFEARNQPQDALLFAEPQMILKAHQVVAVGSQILLA
jgi:hypothetical protein